MINFFYDIFSLVWDCRDYLWDTYNTVKGWIPPFHLLQYPIYGLHQTVAALLSPIANFAITVDQIITKVGEILNISQIVALLQTWLTWAEWAWNWVANAVNNVLATVETWWVQKWAVITDLVNMAIWQLNNLIDGVAANLATLRTSWDDFWTVTWPAWMFKFDSLATAWDNFWTITFPTLITGTGVQVLINSTLTTWFPFYNTLALLWDSVAAFITNPLDYLLDRLETWFWGPST
jgi:hypothetical protein